MRKWFSLDEDRPKRATLALETSFLSESTLSSELRSNPLLLSLLCALYTTTHYIPRNLPEVYERCAELMFETWDRSRGLESPHRFAAHIKPAVQRLAWYMFTDEKQRLALPRAEMKNVLASFMLERRFDDSDEAAAAAEEFLDFCAGRAWVLLEVGTDQLSPLYGFVHRTFLEYFAASQLVKQDPSADGVWSALRLHCSDSQWDLVAQLSVQLLDRAREDGGERFFELLQADVDEAIRAGRLQEVGGTSLFGVRLLHVLSPSTRAIQTMADLVVSLATRFSARDRRSADSQWIGPDYLDSPLYEMLHIEFPDNMSRVGSSIARALCKDIESAAWGSAALIAAVIHGGFVEVPQSGNVRTELERQWGDRAVGGWRTVLRGPGRGEIAEFGGPMMLYEHTRVLGTRIPAIAWSVLNETVGPRASSSGRAEHSPYLRTLLSIFGELDPHEGRFELLDKRWQELTAYFDSDSFMRLDAHVRVSSILLLLPILDQSREGLFRNLLSHADRELLKVVESRRKRRFTEDEAALMADWGIDGAELATLKVWIATSNV